MRHAAVALVALVLAPAAGAWTTLGTGVGVTTIPSLVVTPSATLLASTAKTPVQAFRIGSAVATQFHPEADAALLEAWLATPSMIDGVDPAEVALIRRDGGVHLPRLRETALRGLGTFASDVERRRQA